MKHLILFVGLLTINKLSAQVGVPRSPDLEAVADRPIHVVFPEDTSSQAYQVCLSFMKYWKKSKLIPVSEQEFVRNADLDKVYFKTRKTLNAIINAETRDTTITYYINQAGIVMFNKKALEALQANRRLIPYEFLMEFRFNEDVTTKTGSGDRLAFKNRIQQTEFLLDNAKSIRLFKDFADKDKLPKLMGDTLFVVFRDRIPHYERKTFSGSRTEIDNTIRSYQEALSTYYHYPFKIISESQLNVMAREKRPCYYLHFTDLRVYTRPWTKKYMQYSIVNSVTGAELFRDRCEANYAGLMITNEWKAIIGRIYKGMGVLKQYKSELAKDRKDKN